MAIKDALRRVPFLYAWLRSRHYRKLARQYAGDAVECPCCGNRLGAFAPLPGAGTEGVFCPHCTSHARHRLLALYIQRETDWAVAKPKLLHVAPESSLAGTFKGNPNYLTVDLDPRAAMQRADLTALDFEDSTWDGVLCSHVLEHIPDDRAAMREMRRVLKPVGLCVLMVPYTPEAETDEDPTATRAERIRRFGQANHVRQYGRDFVDRLTEAGFDVTVREFAQELGADTVARHGLPTDEPIFECRSSA